MGMQIQDMRYRVTRTRGNILSHQTESGRPYLDGTVTTPHGIVSVLSENGYAALWFVWDGEQYVRRYTGGNMTARGLAIIAGRFAAAVAGAA